MAQTLQGTVDARQPDAGKGLATGEVPRLGSADEIGWAPEGGWSTDEADTLVLYEDHAYLVWTWENHFATPFE